MKRIVIPLMFLIISCSTAHDPILVEAISIIEKNSIMRDSINWANYEKKIFKKAENVKSNEGRYKVIQFALNLLNDHHSVFFKPYSDSTEISSGYAKVFCEYKLINEKIGYINIPSCQGDCAIFNGYVRQISAALRHLDENLLSGWVIDLRNNEGGNMWPMILGLSPLIDVDIW